MEDHEEEFYYVEKILSKQDNPTRYLVKWEGWPQEQATWEPLENLENVMHLVEEFEKERNRRKRLTTKLKYKATKSVADNNSVLDEMDASELPNQVVTVKMNDGVLFALVKFDKASVGSDGMPKPNIWVPTSILAEKNPTILIDFYESKIRFNS
jgi:hypothetical protein